MYTLKVFIPDSDVPAEVYTNKRSDEVLLRIPQLLEEHEGCHHIVVYGYGVRLFSVGCDGNRQP